MLAARRSSTMEQSHNRIAQLEKLQRLDIDEYHRRGADGRSASEELLELRRAAAKPSMSRASGPAAATTDDDGRTPREREILQMMQSDIDAYWRLGLHTELAAIRKGKKR